MGSPIFAIASVLSGSIIIPYLKKIKPRILLYVTAKIDFFRFGDSGHTFDMFQKPVLVQTDDHVFSLNKLLSSK